MGYDPKGKVVLITGGSRGIGKEIALAFAKAGARIVLSSRTSSDLEKVAEEIRQGGGEAIAIPANVSRRAEVESIVRNTIVRMGAVDILVNNAGFGFFAEVKDMTVEDWEGLFAVNVWGMIYATHAVLPHMLARGSGQIINMSSVAGKAVFPGLTAYCTSKYAVAAFSLGLRTELHRKGIDVILICPGATGTEFWERGTYKGLKKIGGEFLMQSPKVVAEEVLAASRKRKREVVLTASGKMSIAVSRILPRTTSFVTSQIARTYDWMRPDEP